MPPSPPLGRSCVNLDWGFADLPPFVSLHEEAQKLRRKKSKKEFGLHRSQLSAGSRSKLRRISYCF